MDPRQFVGIPENEDIVFGNSIPMTVQDAASAPSLWNVQSPLTSYSGSRSDDVSSEIGMSSNSQDAGNPVFDGDFEAFEYVGGRGWEF